MQWEVMTVGAIKSAPLKAVYEDYAQRISRYRPFASISLKPAAADRFPNPRAAALDETQRLLEKIQPTDWVVALDERGREFRSEALAEKLESWSQSGKKRLLFVVGGAFGLGPELKARANFLWSLSMLTYPHELAATLLVEQLYRALTIQHHHPYHYGETIG